MYTVQPKKLTRVHIRIVVQEALYKLGYRLKDDEIHELMSRV